MAYTAFTRPENYTGTITDEKGDIHHYANGQYMGTDMKPPKIGPGATCDFTQHGSPTKPACTPAGYHPAMDSERGHGLKGPAGTSGCPAPPKPDVSDLDKRGIGAKSLDYTSINWPHVMDCFHWLRKLGRRGKKDGD